jgi:hypothetical protein
MSSLKKPRTLTVEEQALQDERNREARLARLAIYNPQLPPPPIAMSPPITSSKASSRGTSPQASSSSSSSSSSSNMNQEEEDKCALCWDPLKNSKVYETQCGHSYHEDCYDQIRDDRCPICRESLDNEQRRPFRRPDVAHMDQLVQPGINPEILGYIQTINNNRLFDLALDITHIIPGITVGELQVMIGNANDSYSDSERSSPASSGYSRSGRGSVSSRSSPAARVYSISSDGSNSSRSSPASSGYSRSSPAARVYSRNSPASSVSSRSSRRSRASSNSSRSSRVLSPHLLVASSNSNLPPSPPPIDLTNFPDWEKTLRDIQKRGEIPESKESKKRKRERKDGGKSKRKNDKKNSHSRKKSPRK